MNPSRAELSTLSELLDQAFDHLEQGRPLDTWLAALPPGQAPLLPLLRAMLDEHRQARHAGFMAGPRLDDAASLAGAAPGDTMGPYSLLRELGRGGMAVVWLARRHDGTLQRDVALKMPLLTLDSEAQVQRFERERDALARLAHPHIARLYDAGVTAERRPFIVLEFVDGEPITAACTRRRLDLRARLKLFLQVLDAVDHAHRHLVVHRDIKPSNVFVDAEGQVRLLDFGVAALLAEDGLPAGPSALTAEGGRALTPRYAAPEQMAGEAVSTRSDVYSLGVLLHELLTGALPHASAQRSLAAALNATLHTEPQPPSRVAPEPLRAALRGDLDTVVLKALRRDAAERYGSVDRFAEDIRNVLAHRPVAARPAGWLHGARLFLRRHRQASVAAGLGLVLACGFGATAWQQHALGVEERQRADAVRDFMFDLVDDAEPDEAHPDAEPGGRQMVLGAVRRAQQGYAAQPRLRGELLAELGRMLGRLGDGERSAALLDEALALLEQHAPAGDPALNKARTRLADLSLSRGRLAEAQALAERSLAACTAAGECAKARLYARTVLCNVALRRGDAAQALQQMRLGAADGEAGFGAGHAESALPYLNLAIVARQAGELAQARMALEQALRLSRGAVLRAADRVDLQRTQAVIELDSGNYAVARQQLQALLALREGRRAQVWRLLASAEWQLGDATAAHAAATQALALARQEGNRIEIALAHQGQARALSLAGAGDAALATMQQARQDLLDAGFAAASMELLRGRRYQAEMLLRSGRWDAGLAELRAVAQAQQAAGSAQALELAQSLDLAGVALRETGHAGEARQWHARAACLYEGRLPADHPLRLRNALYRELALAAEQPARPDAGWTVAAQAYAQRFPDHSAWRGLIGQALAAFPCAGQPACALIL